MTLKTRAELNSDADTLLADNTTRDISPADIRGRIKDLADSAILNGDVSAFSKIQLNNVDAAAWLAALAAQAQFSGLTIPANDYNNATTDGIYYGAGALSVNGPPSPASYGPCLVLRRGSSVVQIAVYADPSGATNYAVAMRGGSGSGWTNWRSVFGEYGSNANGNYVRYPDGTQICWSRINLTVDTSANIAIAPVSTFPAAFVAPPSVIAFPSRPVGASGAYRVATVGYEGTYPTATAWRVSLFETDGANFTTAVTYPIDMIASGRWFL